MANKKIRMGMIGGGQGSFIGILHRIAAYMGEDYRIVGGVFDHDFEQAKDFAEGFSCQQPRVAPLKNDFLRSVTSPGYKS